jgi:hypothetical protein
MSQEIETIISTENGVRISVAEWDDGGVWLSLINRGSSAYTPLTRAEADQLLAGLQAILSKEVST